MFNQLFNRGEKAIVNLTDEKTVQKITFKNEPFYSLKVVWFLDAKSDNQTGNGYRLFVEGPCLYNIHESKAYYPTMIKAKGLDSIEKETQRLAKKELIALSNTAKFIKLLNITKDLLCLFNGEDAELKRREYANDQKVFIERFLTKHKVLKSSQFELSTVCHNIDRLVNELRLKQK